VGRFEALLPMHMINIALLTLDGTSPELCMESPFPVSDAAEQRS
jgi:hypothetical protein